MTISNGLPILAADLNTIWDGIDTLVTVAGQKYEVDVFTFNFDNVDSDLTDAVRYLIPATDGEIVGIVAIIGETGGKTGTLNFQITGSINSTIEIPATITSLSTTRTNVTLPSGRFGVILGDTISCTCISAPYSGAGPEVVRIHVLLKTKWSAI